jgi:hypothetical protein
MERCEEVVLHRRTVKWNSRAVNTTGSNRSIFVYSLKNVDGVGRGVFHESKSLELATIERLILGEKSLFILTLICTS